MNLMEKKVVTVIFVYGLNNASEISILRNTHLAQEN